MTAGRVSHVNDVAVVYERPESWQPVSRPERTTSKALLVRCGQGRSIWLPKKNCRIYAGAYYASHGAIQAARDWAAKNPRKS